MDHLQRIANEFIRLYRQQFTLWVLGKMEDLSDADLVKYDRRKRRIEELRLELERMISTSQLDLAA
jgi:superfamily I DNA and RNA helicase